MSPAKSYLCQKMGKLAHFRNLREENSSGIPARGVYRSIYKSKFQIALGQYKKCKPIQSES